jgi:hypothetical protein
MIKADAKTQDVARKLYDNIRREFILLPKINCGSLTRDQILCTLKKAHPENFV